MRCTVALSLAHGGESVGGGVVLSRREGADEKAERVGALDGYRGMMRGAGESAGARALARKPEKN